jgi:Josephin
MNEKKFLMPRNNKNEIPSSKPRVEKVVKMIEVGRVCEEISLMKQADANQCGVCAVYNFLQLANIQTDYINTAAEPVDFMNEMRSKLGLSDATWLSTTNLRTFLNNIFPSSSGQSVVVGSGFYAVGEVSELGKVNLASKISEAVNSNKYYGFIVNSHNHYITIVNFNGPFVKFDSLTGCLEILSSQDVEKVLQNSVQYFGVKKNSLKNLGLNR